MNNIRLIHTATLLQNGKVLVAGGISFDSSGNIIPIDTSEIYDPSNNTWTLSANMNNNRTYHTDTLLQNVKVLVAGGGYDSSGNIISSEIYTPTNL
jgi:N-acetylneuraminic acid mutarotase